MEGTNGKEHEICERNALYYLPDQNFVFNEEPIDESIFNVTPNDLKISQRHLTAQTKREWDRPFLSKSVLDRKNCGRKKKAYKHAVISFSIQNRFVIQANFYSAETVSSLFDFCRSILVDSLTPFNLHFLREIVVENKLKSLLDADIAPTSRFIILFPQLASLPEDLSSLINLTRLQKSTEENAELIRRDWISKNTLFETVEDILSNNNIPLRNTDKRTADVIFDSQRPGSSGSNIAKSLNSKPNGPKWFKRT